jgi:hypothetical protein
MDWRRWNPARFSKSRKRSKVDSVRVPEVEAKSNLSSGPVRSPGAVHNKMDAQVACRPLGGQTFHPLPDLQNSVALLFISRPRRHRRPCPPDASPAVRPRVRRHRSFSARSDPVSACRASGLGFVAQPSNPTVLW